MVSWEKFRQKKILAAFIGVAILIASISGFVKLNSTEMEFSANSLVFSAIGDPHYGWTQEQNAGKITDAWSNDPKLSRPEFAINIGDFTHFGSKEGYQVATQHSFGNYLLPWMFVFGNHDTADYKTGTGRNIFGDGSGEADTQYFDQPYDAIEGGMNYTGTMGRNYAFLWDNILFLTFGDMGNTMLLTQSQRQWLDYMTDLYPNKTTITISHQGFHPQSPNSVYRFYNDLDWWETFIQENPQIALHIHGHNHEFLHYKYHGLDAIDCGITNGMGKPWSLYFEITDSSISAGVYNVAKNRWSKPNFFQKNLETGWKDEGISWYSVSHRVQDGQSFEVDNRILAENHAVQIIGSNPELVEQNREFDFWGNPNNKLNWIGYEQDDDNGNQAGYVEFNGTDKFSTSTSPAFHNQLTLGWYTKWTEGKVPDSTTPRAIPGETYTIKARLKADREISDAMDISASILGKNLSRIILEETHVISNIDLTSNYQWVQGTLTVPTDQEAWILKTTWDSKKENINCFLDEWSVTRVNCRENTEGFNVTINEHTIEHQGNLSYNQFVEFDLPNNVMQNKLKFEPSMGGSQTGMIRLIYDTPLIWSDDLSIGFGNRENEEISCRFRKSYPEDLGVPLSIALFRKNITIENADLHTIKGHNAYTLSTEQLASTIVIRT